MTEEFTPTRLRMDLRFHFSHAGRQRRIECLITSFSVSQDDGGTLAVRSPNTQARLLVPCHWNPNYPR